MVGWKWDLGKGTYDSATEVERVLRKGPNPFSRRRSGTGDWRKGIRGCLDTSSGFWPSEYSSTETLPTPTYCYYSILTPHPMPDPSPNSRTRPTLD